MAEAYISELGDSLSHGVANTNGDRVKIIAPKLYNDGNGNHPSIATALAGKSSTSHTHTTSIASDSSSGTVVTLAHDTQYKLTAGGTSVLFKTPADSNTDTKVTQTADTSSDAAYPILAKNTTATATITDTSRFTSGVTLNPKNKSITATTFIGALSGNAATATVADSVEVDYTYQVTPTDFDLIVPAVDQARIYSINGQYPNGPSGASTTGYWGVLRVFWRNYCPYQLYIGYGSAYLRYSTTYDSTEEKWTNWNAWTPFNTDTLVKANKVTDTTAYKILASKTTDPQGASTEANYAASCTITGAGTMGAVAYSVNSKCTLQFNTTTNALDFVFA